MSSPWEKRQQQGNMLFQRDLPVHLRWAHAYVQKHRNQPIALKAELATIFTLLTYAQPFTELHTAVLDVLRELGNAPYRLGAWSAWETQLRFAVQAAKSLGKLDDEVYFANHLSDLLYFEGRVRQTSDLSVATVGLPHTEHSAVALVNATNKAVDSLVMQSRWDEARSILQTTALHPLIQAAVDRQHPLVCAYLHFTQGITNYCVGEFIDANVFFTAGMDGLDADQPAHRFILAELRRMRGLTHWALGFYAEAKMDLRVAIHLYKAENDAFMVSMARGNLGLLYWGQGDLFRAERITRHTVQVAHKLNAHLQLLAQVGNLGLVYLSKGWHERALTEINRHLKLAQQHEVASEVGRALGNRGAVLFHLGEYERALQDLHRSADGQTRLILRATNYIYLSRTYHQLKQRREARQYAFRAKQISQQVDSVSLRVVVLRCLAEIGHSEREEHLKTAYTLAKSAGRRLDIAATTLEIAHLRRDARLWARGAKLLGGCEADSWLNGKSVHDLPRMVMMV
jgi:tetratricopeptide (TPR) repeat protein